MCFGVTREGGWQGDVENEILFSTTLYNAMLSYNAVLHLQVLCIVSLFVLRDQEW
jgi:hypothetical protein